MTCEGERSRAISRPIDQLGKRVEKVAVGVWPVESLMIAPHSQLKSVCGRFKFKRGDFMA